MSKRNLFLLIVLSAFIFSGTGYGATGGLTNGKGLFKLDLDYFSQEFDMDLTSSTATPPSTWNLDYEVPYDRNVLMLRGSYGLFDQLDILAGIGMVDDELVADRRDNTAANHVQKGSDNFLWQVGLRSTFIKMESGLYLGGLATYSRWDSGDDSYVAYGASDPRDISTEWEELGLSLYTGTRLGKFSPYAGIEFTDIKVTQKLAGYPLSPGFSGVNKYEIEDKWGAVAGITYALSKHFDINAETHLMNQTRFDIGLSYKF